MKLITRSFAALLLSGMTLSASANSIGFDQTDLFLDNGQVTVSVIYDFTEFPMFGGGLDLTYDTFNLEFVSFEQGPFAADVQAPASPEGALVAPGLYEGFGIGTFEFFNGINSAGTIGTFTFNVINVPRLAPTPCGQTLCLSENGINPFVNLAGESVGSELLMTGTPGVPLVFLPVPAAVWLMLSGVGALIGFGRKSV